MDLSARFVGIWMVFAIYIVVDVEGVAYGLTCSTTSDAWGDCTETTNIVCDTTCKCAPNYFRLTSSAACAAQVAALDATCDTAETATDQCAVADSECRADSGSDKCLCKSSHYTSGGACVLKIVFDQTCVSTVTAADQCAGTNQACSLDTGTTYKCQCTSAYYSDTSVCQDRIAPGATCAVNQCVEHATCDTVSSPTKCECDAGYTASPATSPTMCSGVVKFASLSYMYVVPILVSMMSLLR